MTPYFCPMTSGRGKGQGYVMKELLDLHHQGYTPPAILTLNSVDRISNVHSLTGKQETLKT